MRIGGIFRQISNFGIFCLVIECISVSLVTVGEWVGENGSGGDNKLFKIRETLPNLVLVFGFSPGKCGHYDSHVYYLLSTVYIKRHFRDRLCVRVRKFVFLRDYLFIFLFFFKIQYL